MKKELTTVIMVMVDGKVKPLEDLTEEACWRRWRTGLQRA